MDFVLFSFFFLLQLICLRCCVGITTVGTRERRRRRGDDCKRCDGSRRFFGVNPVETERGKRGARISRTYYWLCQCVPLREDLGGGRERQTVCRSKSSEAGQHNMNASRKELKRHSFCGDANGTMHPSMPLARFTHDRRDAWRESEQKKRFKKEARVDRRRRVATPIYG